MKVQFYIPKPNGAPHQQYLLLPYGQKHIPREVAEITWRKFFVSEIDVSPTDATLKEAVGNLVRTGYALLPLRTWSRQWSDISTDEFADLEEPDTWQDAFYRGWQGNAS